MSSGHIRRKMQAVSCKARSHSSASCIKILCKWRCLKCNWPVSTHSMHSDKALDVLSRKPMKHTNKNADICCGQHKGVKEFRGMGGFLRTIGVV